MTRSSLFYIIVLLAWFESACSSVRDSSTEYVYNENLVEQQRIEKIRKYTQVLNVQIDSLFDYEMDSTERSNRQITGLFKINRIYKGNGLYVITISSNDDSCCYELYSVDNQINCSYETIREGMSYYLTLEPCYSDFGHRSRPKEISRPFHVDNYLVVPAPIYFGQIYYTRNLIGLKYHHSAHNLNNFTE